MKRGFILVETIAVVCVICIILVMLYTSYSNIITNVNSQSKYDNTEYIYKTSLIRDLLNKEETLKLYSGIILCQNKDFDRECVKEDCDTEFCELTKFLKVEGVYIVDWNDNKNIDPVTVAATTQKYIKQFDDKEMPMGTKKLVVMYKDENDENSFQYASLKYNMEE